MQLCLCSSWLSWLHSMVCTGADAPLSGRGALPPALQSNVPPGSPRLWAHLVTMSIVIPLVVCQVGCGRDEQGSASASLCLHSQQGGKWGAQLVWGARIPLGNVHSQGCC